MWDIFLAGMCGFLVGRNIEPAPSQVTEGPVPGLSAG